MSATALSEAQFGALRPQSVEPAESIPLPGSAQTYTSAQRAMVWRKPSGISGQQATYGSFFNPFGNSPQPKE